jgi:hypothetical protein
MLRKILISTVKILSILFLIFISYFNYKLYYNPKFTEPVYSYNIDVLNQLNHLETELEDSADIKMQLIFPEGYVFMNSLYALSWINFLEKVDSTSYIYSSGLKQIDKSLKKLNSKKAKDNFDKSLPLEYGIFYQGWRNYVLGKKLELLQNSTINPNDIKLFKQNCKNIHFALINSPIPYLESYREEIWPADNIVAIASLALYDNIFKPKYNTDIDLWMNKIKQNLDPKTGLIPHKVYFDSGETVQGARGSSQSLILNFLIDIDEVFAFSQFKIYKNTFLDR